VTYPWFMRALSFTFCSILGPSDVVDVFGGLALTNVHRVKAALRLIGAAAAPGMVTVTVAITSWAGLAENVELVLEGASESKIDRAFEDWVELSDALVRGSALEN
jgi:hypothetical protein